MGTSASVDALRRYATTLYGVNVAPSVVLRSLGGARHTWRAPSRSQRNDRDQVLTDLTRRGPLELARSLGLRLPRYPGRSVRVPCPAHGGADANCSIGLRDGRIVWHCFVCRAGGDAFALVAAVHKLDVRSDFRNVLDFARQLA